ncbi:hypothetical protein ACJVC5_17680 [Peredibacter sp. HCB2-198]|uniref:hypothetical protein n=1 Tax=Peredibacter sp. HCB2-198 TaxID=3383025 RepID=UPI0038B6A1DD
MKGPILILAILSLTTQAAVPESIALSMVPRGKVDLQQGRDFTIKSLANTKIKIEFRRNGKFEEASGDNLNKGDELEPGEGMISLSSAAQKLQEKGIKPEGHWSLEQDPKFGWIYEVNHQYLIDAKTGKALNDTDSPKTVQLGTSP